jgi:hypothetical protein
MKRAESNHSQSAQLFARAQRVIPSGVNNPVRAFRGGGLDLRSTILNSFPHNLNNFATVEKKV